MIVTRDLRKVYGEGRAGEVAALDGVSLEIPAGELSCVLGRSGSGKSTLMNLLGGLDRPTGGSLQIAGLELSELSERALADFRARTIGFVFQQFHLQKSLKAWENVALPLVFTGVARRQRKALALDMLDRVGLDQRADHRPTELSGGEQQRVALARALVTKPKLLLGDEPTGNLDTKTASRIMELICEANDAGTTVVIVTHDRSLANEYARRVVEMEDGKVISDNAGVLA